MGDQTGNVQIQPKLPRFVLRPCHIRAEKVVPDGDPIELDWPKLVALLAPSQTYDAQMTLRRMKTNAYVGLLKRPLPKGSPPAKVREHESAPPTNFLFYNVDATSNDITWLLKRIPDLPDILKALYVVDVALFDTKIEEHSSGEPA
jgi:hypothetical protein